MTPTWPTYHSVVTHRATCPTTVAARSRRWAVKVSAATDRGRGGAPSIDVALLCATVHTRTLAHHLAARSHCIRPSARMLFVEEVVTRVLDSVVLTPAIYRTHVLVIGTDRTYARVMPLDHSCVLYTAVLWSLAFTHVNTRAHAFLAPAPPRLFARIIQRTRTSRRNFSAPRARSPRRAACPATAGTPRRALY